MEFADPIRGEDGKLYLARACGAESSGMWQGWIEFESVEGGAPIRSPRETTQPNRTDTEYWATGLSPVYLEGALRRALHPLTLRQPPPPRRSSFEAPAPEPLPAPPAADTVLNPFSVYQKGEALLRRQLAALSAWHLVNIVRAYRIDTQGANPDDLAPSALIDAIVDAARQRSRPLAAD